MKAEGGAMEEPRSCRGWQKQRRGSEAEMMEHVQSADGPATEAEMVEHDSRAHDAGDRGGGVCDLRRRQRHRIEPWSWRRGARVEPWRHTAIETTATAEWRWSATADGDD
ncbi:hypothetical protein PIB30_016743 [Stylosanthes scabra]|uniref:Uncharacterized protein n=1 Tax=Stylosanthes scabra TaxID=79078 RepID=A0ABU6Z491_9FABA|nr:hypothetical protein [Stylosanthes scabra]